MSKYKNHVHILLANRLDNGRCVFFTAEHDWHPDFKKAAKAQGDALIELEKIARTSPAATQLIAITTSPLDDKGIALDLKTRMQTHGPTVRPDLDRS